jgi:hypothetical protein
MICSEIWTRRTALFSIKTTPRVVRAGAVPVTNAQTEGRSGSVHPNPHAEEGDGAAGHRVNPAPPGVDNLPCQK